MNASPAPSPVTGVSLRCGSCGAPYGGTPQGELLRCGYCGTTQRMVDARQFLDHFMAQVTAFVRQAVPAGLDVSRSDTVDPMARLAAFNMGVRPRLSTESNQYRFRCFNLLSTPFTPQPFSTSANPTAAVDPTSVSVFVAQVQYVSGLAVDDASRGLIRDAGGLATCYQSVLVAARLAGGAEPERFHLISQNLKAAAKAVESTGRWPGLVARLEALASQSDAVDLYLSGRDFGEARRLLGTAGEGLGRARVMLTTTPDIGYMTTAVDQELAGVRTIGSMITIAETSPTVLPHPLAYAQRLSGVLNGLAQSAPGDWAPSFRTMRLREEVFRRAAEVRSAQAGGGSVKVVASGNGTLVPFWVVELPYTFETGVAWTKKGKEVPETLLVAATFPTDLSNLHGAGTSRGLTDVFAAGRAATPGRFTDHIRGREQKITESGGVVALLQSVSTASAVGSQAIPPFTTEAEALKLVQVYVDSAKAANPKVAAQLRGSSPRILDMVYVPCVLHTAPLVPWLGPLSPVSLGDPQTLLGFVA